MRKIPNEDYPLLRYALQYEINEKLNIFFQ
jgi:hypothetical protein